MKANLREDVQERIRHTHPSTQDRYKADLGLDDRTCERPNRCLLQRSESRPKSQSRQDDGAYPGERLLLQIPTGFDTQDQADVMNALGHITYETYTTVSPASRTPP